MCLCLFRVVVCSLLLFSRVLYVCVFVGNAASGVAGMVHTMKRITENEREIFIY